MQASNQWAHRPTDQRFQTLDALKAHVMKRRSLSRSTDIDLSRVTAAEQDGTITINHGIAAVEPTHWSFGQLSARLHAPADYLRALPTDLAVLNINHGIKRYAEENGALKFMSVTRDDDDSEINTLQAVTGTKYGRIWDADCVQAVEKLVEKSNGKFHNPLAYASRRMGDSSQGLERAGLYASDRDVFMFMIDGGSLLEGGDRAQLHRGFFCWNSEVGSKTFGLTTFLFNAVCGNHIIWGAQDVNELTIRHSQNGPTRFDVEAAPLLLSYANAAAAPVEAAIKRAVAYIVLPANTADTDRFDVINSFCNRHAKFSKAEIRSAIDFAKAEEGDCRTLWHVVQGLTAYARGFDHIDSRVDLETRAGKLLDVVKN